MSSDPRVGSDLAGYRIERVLGRGGMGIVYLAEQEGLGRKVALKVLSPELSRDEAFRARFARESRTAASIDHPNIIPIFEAGESDGELFIAMRYVETTDLADLLTTHGRLEFSRTLSIIEQVASALDAAHAQGLIHRDVKPGNLLVAVGAGLGASDHVYLSDFGLTKRQAAESRLTQTGTVVGTLAYISPEQLKGLEADARSDQYSLACVLFECLAGQLPFSSGADAAVMYAHLGEPPPSVTTLRPDLPLAIDSVISRGMAKSPDDRFATCGALAAAARASAASDAVAPSMPATLSPSVAAGKPPPVAQDLGTTPEGPVAVKTGPHGRRIRVALLLGSALVAVALAVLVAPWQWGRNAGAGASSDPQTPHTVGSPTPDLSPSVQPAGPRVGIVGTVTDLITDGGISRNCNVTDRMPVVVRDADGNVLGNTRTSGVTAFGCSVSFSIDLPEATVYEIRVGAPQSISWITTTTRYTLPELQQANFRVELFSGGE